MRAYIAAQPDNDNPPQFQAPGNIVFLSVDKATGDIAAPEAPGVITETFISGTQPGGLAQP
jgi:membrane carboxypeptidase/penicillin-binding protein